ncbi:hypothetical protein PLIP_a3301 [Pseudoalteromonas lipolytica LMEB 39]|nr:hypothetical protein [Pseudoalteromonas lipolytica LMEB 39]
MKFSFLKTGKNWILYYSLMTKVMFLGTNDAINGFTIGRETT